MRYSTSNQWNPEKNARKKERQPWKTQWNNHIHCKKKRKSWLLPRWCYLKKVKAQKKNSVANQGLWYCRKHKTQISPALFTSFNLSPAFYSLFVWASLCLNLDTWIRESPGLISPPHTHTHTNIPRPPFPRDWSWGGKKKKRKFIDHTLVTLHLPTHISHQPLCSFALSSLSQRPLPAELKKKTEWQRRGTF